MHPHHDRVICVREAARLHSFPDWFCFHATKWHGFREVGNAVPPLLGRVVGQQIMAALGQTPQKPEGVIALGDRQLLAHSLRDTARYWQPPERSAVG
ncbi:MAG: DNA cytosine methyltransferase [Spirulinaceae cyanobacterium SM2_1_0]|nr:DNA cytosine methyltransferase [Spirulinaceae cyanobacterium SM2_1_0]